MRLSFKRSLNAINEFIELKRFDEEVLGIIVFGSFAKGKLGKTSDIDVLLLMKDGKYLRKIENHDGLKFEVYMAPVEIFISPFNCGRNLFFDMFRLQVLRTGKIFYDQKGLLNQLSIEANNQKIPNFYEKIMLNRVYERIRNAEKHFWIGHLKYAESELQAASIEAARTLLLKINEPEINIPRLIIPHLRKMYPDFYKIFREIHGLDKLGKTDIELEAANLADYLKKIADKYGAVKDFRAAIRKARREFLNAEDCLERGDYDSAILQLRLSTSILNRYLPINSKFLCDMGGFSSYHPIKTPTKIKEQLSTLRNALADQYT